MLARPPGELLQRIGSRRSGVKLATGLDPETAHRVRELGISGIDLEAYPQRVYPQGQLFANVVGFLNLERVAQAGLEQSRDRDLRRQEVTMSMRRGADGTPFLTVFRPGRSTVTTCACSSPSMPACSRWPSRRWASR